MLATRLSALLAVLAFTMIAFAGQASAHATLIATTPAGFEVLDTAPREISLRFSETVDVSLAAVRLLDPRGAGVGGVSRPVHQDGRTDTVSVAVPTKLADGTYTVTYRVVSADSHPVSGAFAFSVGAVTGGVARDAEPAGVSGAVSVLAGLARWLAYAGLALLVGTAFFVAACWPGGEAARGARRLLWTGWAALVAATIATLLLYEPGAAFGATLGGRLGIVLAIRVGLLGLVAIALVRLRRRAPFGSYDRYRRRGVAVLAAGAALATTWELANHNAAGTQVAIALPAGVVHLLAVAVWLGGLPVLLGVLLRSGDVAGMRVAVPRFSGTALVCVAVLVVTGTYQAWRAVGGPAALFATTYGLVLVAKLGLVGVLLLLGAFARNWVRRQIVSVTDKRRVRRGPERREIGRFRRMVAVEVVLAAAALGATSVLVNTEPAAAEMDRIRAEAELPARTGPVRTVLPFDTGGPLGTGRLAVLVTPGVVGPNEVHLAVFDENGRAKQVPELRAELRLPSKGIAPIPVDLRLLGGDHAIGLNVPITMPGRWELAVTVRTSETDQTVVRVPVGAR
jgi:copper transport protein